MASAIQQLKDLRTAASNDKGLGEKDRLALIAEARGLILDLETDGEILSRTQWGQWETVSIDIAIRMGLLDALKISPSPQSAEQLAANCNVEPLLMQRILRCLGSYGAVAVTSTSEGHLYAANKVSNLYTTDRGILHMRWVFGVLASGWTYVPEKLQKNNWQSLRGGTHTVHTEIRGKPEETLWALIMPEEIQTAGRFMPTYNTEHRSWLEVYPAEERLIKGAKNDANAVLLVDVGGGVGGQADGFRAKFPNVSGKVIVQDLPETVKGPEGVEAMPHDFFSTQPVKGARAYYLRYIMHDWSDEDNVRILSHIREAMEPGYSKVIINDWRLPDSGASTLMTSMDLCMMAVFGGEERHEYRHKQYIEAAGLKIVGVWDLEDGTTEAVFECEIA